MAIAQSQMAAKSELFKHGKDIVAKPITHIINASLEQHKSRETLGEGVMITLPKPQKPPGLAANLRPIVLLISIRTILSITVLCCIRDKVDYFTGLYQSSCK